MNYKNIKIIGLTLTLAVLGGCSSKTSNPDIIVSMDKDEVSIKEAYDYNRKQTIGQATSKII
ncbi:MAG: hypothetical protein ACRCTA_01750, partial [Bacilli bacterium]